MKWRNSLLTFALILACASARAQVPLVFRDVAEEVGLFPALSHIAGHGAAWGDVKADQRIVLKP
ncbi:MAG TPA: hypothetical protein VFI31_29170 [Pirellulales bacterium]|nr:hypothetical protein [Pirellulales bacterium]